MGIQVDDISFEDLEPFLGRGRVPVPEEFVGKTLAESGIRERTGCTVVGVRSESGMKVATEPTHLLSESSDLVMIATAEAEDRFLQLSHL